MPKNDPTAKISKFLGVNNTEDPADMGRNEFGAGWLTDALNMDTTNSFKLQVRPGFSVVSGAGGSTAAFNTADETTAYRVTTGGVLQRVESFEPITVTQLATGIATTELYWAEAGNLVFFSGESKGVISGNDVMAFGIPTPEAPGLVEVSGSLDAGRYLAAVVLRDQWGREGGCGGVSEIDLSEGGIRFNIPAVSGYETILYLSRINGETLLQVGPVDDGFTLVSGGPSSYPLDAAQMGGYPPPDNAGPIAFHESKIWVGEYDPVSDISFIHPSKPFWYHLFPLDQYVPVPGRVLALASAGGYLIIGTNKGIHAYNDTLNDLANYGLVPGQPIAVKDGAALLWTQRGMCTAMPFKNLTDSIYSVAPGLRAAVGIRQSGGMNTAIVCTDTGGTANNRR